MTLVLSINISPHPGLWRLFSHVWNSAAENGDAHSLTSKHAAKVLLFAASLRSKIKRRKENSTFDVTLPQGPAIWIWSFVSCRWAWCATLHGNLSLKTTLTEQGTAPNTRCVPGCQDTGSRAQLWTAGSSDKVDHPQRQMGRAPWKHCQAFCHTRTITAVFSKIIYLAYSSPPPQPQRCQCNIKTL